MKILGSTEDVFAESAAATPVVGVEIALGEGIMGEDETVVVNTTGFGFKDTENAKRTTGDVHRVDPDLLEVQ